MEEVKRQLSPAFRTIERTEEAVDSLRQALTENSRTTESINRKILGIWSNGSGGPPGYLEVARAQDEKWKKELLEQVGDMKKEVGGLKDAHLLRTGEETGHLKWFKKWAAIATVVIAFLALMVGLFDWLEGRKVKSGDLENPFDIIQQKPVPVVYAKETPLHHQAINE